jgi:hypothetical protein
MDDDGRTCATAVLLAILAAIALAPGCTKAAKDPRDAQVSPPDGHLDSGPHPVDAGNGASDTGPTPADAAVDGSDDTSSACTPAACEAADGGADADPPPWGCPEACDPPCEGDTVCCDNGTCQQRSLHGCDDGCDVELTLTVTLLCSPNYYSALVCNRGATECVEPGQLVRFHVGDEVFCETETTEPIAPCTCIGVNCTGSEPFAQGGTEIRGTLNPDDPPPACGSPLGGTDTGEVWYCD